MDESTTAPAETTAENNKIPLVKNGDEFFAVLKQYGGMVKLNSKEDFTMFSEGGGYVLKIKVLGIEKIGDPTLSTVEEALP